MTKLHPKAFYLFWWSYFWIFLVVFFVIGIFFSAIFVPFFATSIAGLVNFAISFIASVILLSLALGAIWARLMYNSYSFDIAKRHFNVNWGVIRKHSATIPYERIQNIDINRGIMARVLGLSEVWIQTAGISAGIYRYGAARLSEGIIPGLKTKDAEKLRNGLLRKIKGRRGGL